MINFTCPNCNESLSAPDSLAGRSECCPSCKSNCVVPFREIVCKKTVVPKHKKSNLGIVVLFAVVALIVGVVFFSWRANMNRAKTTAACIKSQQVASPEYVSRSQKYFDSLRRLCSDIEVGISYVDFAARVRDLNYERKVFSEMKCCNGLADMRSDFHMFLATVAFTGSLESWKTSIDYDSEKYKRILQREWANAHVELATMFRKGEIINPIVCPMCEGKMKFICLYCKDHCRLCNNTGKYLNKECLCKCRGGCNICENTGEVKCSVCGGKGKIDLK